MALHWARVPDYIGDISRDDAEVLHFLAMDSKSILEFGVGASTQVIANACKEGAAITSIDTSPEWIEKTKRNLERLKIKTLVTFQDYSEFMLGEKGKYDLVFVDGVDNLRLPFAEAVWPYIRIGGKIAFHDTRREADIQNVLKFISDKTLEIQYLAFNDYDSNITVITKKVLQPYDNWQITENRLPWQLGYGEPPENQ